MESKHVIEQIWNLIQPIFLAGCTLIGVGYAVKWAIKNLPAPWFIKNKERIDRRMLNNDILNEFFKLAEQNNAIIEKFSGILDMHLESEKEFYTLLSKMQETQVDILHKIDKISMSLHDGR